MSAPNISGPSPTIPDPKPNSTSIRVRDGGTQYHLNVQPAMAEFVNIYATGYMTFSSLIPFIIKVVDRQAGAVEEVRKLVSGDL